MRATLTPGPLCGSVAAPPSKSMGHRALLCAALAEGTSRITGLGASEDIEATLRCIRALGATARPAPDGALLVKGTGGALCGHAPHTPVDCGESGSTLRFLIPLFALCGAPVTLTGHGRLLQRPQGVYEALFLEKGCRFAQSEAGISVCGPLPAGEYTLDGSVSSQFISGLLFALPLLSHDSTVHIRPPFESRSYVQLTLRALADFGVAVTWADDFTLCIKGNQKYTPCSYCVEGDYSQAAFWAVLGAVRGGITVTGLRADSLQGDAVILPLLAQCGAVYARAGTAVHFEKSALHAAPIDLADCPDLGPILMVLAQFCGGQTVIRNAGRLRLKESDRIAAMEAELHRLGGCIESKADIVRLAGCTLHATDELCGHNDHRIVMALCIAALAAGVPVQIAGAEAVRKSYPHFFSDLAALGAEVKLDEGT